MRQIISRLLSFRDFVRGLDKRKAGEAGRTTFAIIGAAGSGRPSVPKGISRWIRVERR